MMSSFYRRIISAALLLIFSGCASQGSPPGGPEDETPPSVVSMFPPDGATEVSQNIGVEVEFSEYLTSASVAPSIFISPYTDIEPEVIVKRRNVSIRFNEQLQDSTTYIINFGTSITDLRGNSLPQSITLAFSTGPTIDQGVMAGRIYPGEGPDGNLSIIAYLRDAMPIDSLLTRRPDYRSNPNERGVFQFNNLALGDYFFMGLLDQNNNSIYDPGEWIGVPHNPFWNVTDSMTTFDLQMQMFQYPADSLILTKAEQQNRHQLTVGFNRPPVQDVTEDHFLFVSSENDTFPPAAVMAADTEGEYLLEHYQTEPDCTYLFLARNLTDSFGLPFAYQRDRRDLEISAKTDTLPLDEPAISISDSLTDISQKVPLEIQWERAITPIHPDSLLLVEGANPDTFRLFWQDDRTLRASPDSLWPPEAWINWTLFDSLVTDLRDSSYVDSLPTTSGSFQIEPGTEYGSFSGSVGSIDTSWILSRIRIQAQPYENGNLVRDNTLQQSVNQDTAFVFERVPPGNYRLKAYYDADSSGNYSPGRPMPFVTSEKFVIFPDSINVRARWETSGITINFPGKK
ncbi:MAG: hypothetical protein GF372_05865 [Candidatus Marinimicrobia bacterium]|nr:hypothetical protein [Candidatus Neomarinimicrobiota bacterium]